MFLEQFLIKNVLRTILGKKWSKKNFGLKSKNNF